MATTENWWQNLPCHFHPSWRLDEITNLDLLQLKRKAQNNAEDSMVVEHKIYQAFLEYPCGKFCNNKKPSLTKALKFLEQADEYITNTLRENNEARIGYGIVINCFRMWKDPHRVKYEDTLRTLNEEKENFPKHEHYIFATRAYSLSRLGPKWIEESQVFFDKALKGYPDNCQWLFGKALMFGRRSRLSIGRDGWTKDAIKKKQENLKSEKDILQTILQKEPDNSLVKVYIGEVLLLLGESEDAELYIAEALACSQNDAKVAEKAGSVYRKLGKIDVAEDIFEDQLTWKETSEAHFQLGKLKKDRVNTKDTTKSEEYLRQALVHFTKGHEIDPAHNPCLIGKAEMTAKVGYYEKAKHVFTDIFEQEMNGMLSAGDSLYVYTVAANLGQRLLEKVFDMDEIVNIYYRFLTLCTIPKRRKQIIKKLKKISENVSSVQFQLYAVFKMAELKRRFGSYCEAIQLYEQLLDLKNGDGELVKVREIRTGLSLAQAKKRLNEGIADNKEDVLEIYSLVSSTIEQGSLEGSYLFAKAAENLRSIFFHINLGIPCTLARIKLILDEKVDILHADFEVKGDDDIAEMIHIDMKRDLIRNLVEQFCTYDTGLADKMQTKNDGFLLKVYGSLEGLRRKRLDFELELFKAHIDGKSWNDNCAHTATAVLLQSRVILDHAIHLYQIEVLRKEPGRSIFPIHFDWKQASVDKETTKKKLRGWCASAFPEYSMPPDVFEHLLQVQPMYDSNNIWLAALGSFSSAEKHKSYQTSETFLLKLKDETKPPIYIAISEIIEKSNHEVERLSLFFMEKCKEIENYTGETTCSLLEPVTNLTLNENDSPELPQGTPASFR
ncbi:interferon-induced protein with tetratricopeptide repeats 1-like [Apostichopus japonicus]|uniref:interferon-induced protein with tetratricopeptide repeats 1-like n=1 Tax=Stichopus japonicus TaxID=307972 RepID=UPI003AB68B76